MAATLYVGPYLAPARKVLSELADEPIDLSLPSNWGGARLVYRLEHTQAGWAVTAYREDEL